AHPGDHEVAGGIGGHGWSVLKVRRVGVHAELRAEGDAGAREALPEDPVRVVLALAVPDDHEISGGARSDSWAALSARRIRVDPELGPDGIPLRPCPAGREQQRNEEDEPSSTHRRFLPTSCRKVTQSSSSPLSSFSLNMYLMLSFRRRMLGSLARLTLMAERSYHSMVPRISSPSFRTSTIRVLLSICFL